MTEGDFILLIYLLGWPYFFAHFIGYHIRARYVRSEADVFGDLCIAFVIATVWPLLVLVWSFNRGIEHFNNDNP